MSAPPPQRSALALPPVDAVVLDVLGTLLDVSGTFSRAAREALVAAGVDGARAEGVAQQWGSAFDERTARIAAGESGWVPAEQLRRDVLADLLAREGVHVPAGALDAAVAAGHHLEPWPDVAEGLADLARAKTVVGLTNASWAQLLASSAAGGLRWHAVLSTALVQTYKPAPAAYQLVPELLGLEPSRTLFVAAHPWDLRAAATHGHPTAHLPRPHTDQPEPGDRFDVQLESLGELARALRRR